MERFKKILCYVGGSADPAPGLNEAVALAKSNNAQLTLIDVLPESTKAPWPTLAAKPDLEKVLVSSRTQDLVEMAAEARRSGLQVKTVVTMGSPFVELIRCVVVDGHDLVVKTAQGNDNRLGGLLGTTALHLMRKCPAPVWVVKPASSDQFDRVVAAVDPKVDEPGVDPLSVKVLELASSLAARSNRKLEVVHAWWLPSESMLRGRRINLPAAEIDGLLREMRGTAERSLDALAERVDLSRVQSEVHLLKGRPDEVIGEFAAHADLAVMGTLSRSGGEGLLIGNTAERVLRQVDCSVLAVKPDGFRTPLRFEGALAGTAA